MIRGRFMNSMGDCSELYALWRRILAEEGRPLGTAVQDAADAMAVYALVFDQDDVPSGAGRLSIQADRFTLDRIGVRKGARGQGLGDLVMRMLLLRAQELSAPSVFVHAPRGTEGFFCRYGLHPSMAGDDQGTPMTASADEIDIEGSCQKGEARTACPHNCADCAQHRAR